MGERLNTQDLIDYLIKKEGVTKKNADNFIREFFSLIEEALEKEKSVKIKGLGTFKLIDVESRESINVNTGERIEIQGHTKISFSPDSQLRDTINKPFAHFETVVLNENVTFEDETSSDDEFEKEDDKCTIEVVNDTQKVLKPETEPEIIEEEPVENTITHAAKETIKIADKAIPEDPIVDIQEETTTKKVIIPPTSEKRSSIKTFLTVAIIATILFCGGILVYMYYPEVFSGPKESNVLARKDSQSEHPIDLQAATDSVTAMQDELPSKPNIEEPTPQAIESTVSSNKVAATSNAPSRIASSEAPVVPDSMSYTIVGTKTSYTMKDGETLIKVALRFYGTKNVWPYLVMHNRSKIKNPNVVPAGTTIDIPELKKK